MKQLLRKLHIGGTATATATTATINHHDHHPVPVLAPSSSSASSSALPSPTPIVVVDPIPNPSVSSGSNNNNSENGVVVDNFGLLEEEEFQMQLALAISASDPDVHKDPESAQIDAAKQISLGYEASLSDTQALVQFQSLRYWVLSLSLSPKKKKLIFFLVTNWSLTNSTSATLVHNGRSNRKK